MKIAVLAIFLWSSISFAQSISPPSNTIHNRKLWLNIALGAGGTKSMVGRHFANYGGIAGEVSLNYRLNYHWLLTARSVSVTSYPYFNGKSTACALVNTANCGNKRSWANEKGLLAGYIFQGDYGYSTLSLGLAQAKGKTYAHSSSAKDKFNVLSLPLESQIFWTPTGFLGLGLIAFADINKYRWFQGALLAVQIGDFQKTSSN